MIQRIILQRKSSDSFAVLWEITNLMLRRNETAL